jgi:hypothetical protein
MSWVVGGGKKKSRGNHRNSAQARTVDGWLWKMAGTEGSCVYNFTETLSEDTQLTIHYMSKLLDRFSHYFEESNICPKTFTIMYKLTYISTS